MNILEIKLQKLNLQLLRKPKCFYPKVVLFDGLKAFRIIDLQSKDESLEKMYEVQEEIVDSVLQEHLLWILLKSGEILVTNLLNGQQTKIIIINYSKVKFLENKSKNKILMRSECGEYLSGPSTDEILKKFEESPTEISINLQRLLYQDVKLFNGYLVNGLYVTIQDGKLICECPITGVIETILSPVSIEYVVSWGNQLIIAEKTKMWIIDLENSLTSYECQDRNNYYVPIAVFNNIFYYIEGNDEEVNTLTIKSNNTSRLN